MSPPTIDNYNGYTLWCATTTVLIDRYKEDDEVLYHVYYVHVDNARRVHLIITGHQLARDEIRKISKVCGWRWQMTKWYRWVRLVQKDDPNEQNKHHFGYWQPVV